MGKNTGKGKNKDKGGGTRLRKVVVLGVLVAGAVFAVRAWRRAQP
jgi:hypothetical protein